MPKAQVGSGIQVWAFSDKQTSYRDNRGFEEKLSTGYEGLVCAQSAVLSTVEDNLFFIKPFIIAGILCCTEI